MLEIKTYCNDNVITYLFHLWMDCFPFQAVVQTNYKQTCDININNNIHFGLYFIVLIEWQTYFHSAAQIDTDSENPYALVGLLWLVGVFFSPHFVHSFGHVGFGCCFFNWIVHSNTSYRIKWWAQWEVEAFRHSHLTFEMKRKNDANRKKLIISNGYN